MDTSRAHADQSSQETGPWSFGAESLLETGKNVFTQGNEELIVRHYFRDRKRGYFVDLGCYNWRWNSTTCYLDKRLGWCGLAIDALSEMGAGFEEKRPHTQFCNYIVSDATGDIGTVYVAGPITSVNPEWKNKFKKFRDIKLPTRQVPKISLNDLLAGENVQKVDFLCMDIEGSELRVLEPFNFEKYAPDLVCIEVGSSPEQPVIELLDSFGYTLIEEYLQYDTVNKYFRPKGKSG